MRKKNPHELSKIDKIKTTRSFDEVKRAVS